MVLRVLKRNISLLSLGVFVLYLIGFAFFNGLNLNNLQYSITFVVVYCVSLAFIRIVNGHKVSLFFLFWGTFGLFIGGRFFACLLNDSLINNVFTLDYFNDYSLNVDGKLNLMNIIFTFMVFSLLGYVIGYKLELRTRFRIVINGNLQSKCNSIIKFLFCFFFAFYIYSFVNSFRLIASEGYAALYLGRQTEEYSGAMQFVSTFFSLCWAYCMTFSSRKTKVLFMGIYVLRALGTILMGARGSFGVVIITLFWIWAKNKKINMFKIGLIVIVGIALLLLIFSFSIRGSESNYFSNIDILQLFSRFIFDQGVSLMTFDQSMKIDSYPLLPYFQTVIPGVSTMYGLLTDTSLQYTDVNFSAYMCAKIDPEMYNSGLGLGWTLLSDLYLFSQRTMLGISILSGLFGYTISTIEVKSRKSDYFKFVSYLIVMPLLLLPRAGSYTIFPLLAYGIVLSLIIPSCYNIIKKLLLCRKYQ